MRVWDVEGPTGLKARMTRKQLMKWQAYANTWTVRRAGQMKQARGKQIIEW